MARTLKRRDFLKATASGGAPYLGSSAIAAAGDRRAHVLAAGSGTSPVGVGKVYMGRRGAGWLLVDAVLGATGNLVVIY